MSVLNEICDKKRDHIAARKQAISIEELQARADKQTPPRGFIKSLSQCEFPAIIAEVKKASPSKGIIRDDFNPAEIAQIYAGNGAACLSVLTDEPYFQGSDDYFKIVRETVSLPLLRKDFMLDPYQIYESRALGADCILLIMAALSDDQAAELYAITTQLGMDTLFEVHDKAELERTLPLNPQMVGVNNRNLKTLEVNIDTSRNLAANIPAGIHKVAESGLSDRATLQDLQTHGYQSFLIGESLMRQPDIAVALNTLRRT